jgi:uncharacterized protein
MRCARFRAFATVILAVTTTSFIAGISSPASAIDRAADAPVVEVPLGVHQFGKLTAPDAVVARVGADGVGWVQPGPGMRFRAGIQRGPSSFEIATDGSIWLLDQENSRLLGWPRGTPDRPTLNVQLPFVPDAFALGPNGTFYATEYTSGPNMIVHSVARDGRSLWQAPMATMNASGVQLRRAADGVLYASAGAGWTPVTTGAGTPLPLDQQRPLPADRQPLQDGNQLVMASPSARELLVSTVDSAGQPVRTWRITSGTDIGPMWNARLSSVGGDPVVTLYVHGPQWRPSEMLVLRLTASGAQPCLHLKSVIWGESPSAEFQVGPAESYYQLQTSRTTGVKIVRFSLSGVTPTPTPTGGAVVPVPTPSQAQPTPTVAPAPTAQPQAAEPTSGSWWPWAGGIALAILVALGAALLIWRHRHPAKGKETAMGRVVHFEIPANDLDRAERFYTTVFGWKAQTFGNPDYRLLITGEDGAPGIDGALATRTGPPANGATGAWVCTVEVDDLAETERAVVAAGGTQVRDRAAIPGVGSVSYFTDTEGNLFNALQSQPSAQ